MPIIKKTKQRIVRRALLLGLFLFCILHTQAQHAYVSGKVLNDKQEAVEFANVTVSGKTLGTATDARGEYELRVPAEVEITVVVSMLGFKPAEYTLELQDGERYDLQVALEADTKTLHQVVVEDREVRKTTLTRLDPKVMQVIPDASGNFESIIKTLPGVASNNELSSQYSVRGGSFDENLVYVNDIEVYRPLLVRSGQQEGLSFINSDMVSSVLFSAGGFDARYGDKMSSVLDIKYKKPSEFEAAFSASLMGGSLMFAGASKDKKFTHISGVRYKTTKYALNSLDTEADYDPRFLDFQTYMTYQLTDKLELGVLGNLASNYYKFVPQDRRTKFGTYNTALELRMYFDGQEVDQFTTYTGALSLNYQPQENLELKWIGSYFHTNESETFDIHSYYWINEVEKDLSSGTTGDSVANIGVGSFLEHARNYLEADVYSFEHRGMFTDGAAQWRWGVKYQREEIADDLSEWQFVDSTGYSLPYSAENVELNYSIKGQNFLASNRVSAFIQNTYNFYLVGGELNLTTGLRAGYWDFNREATLSPRANLSYVPNWERDILFRFSTGFYYQPSFYKEMRLLNEVGDYGQVEVELNKEIKSQKSYHFVLGSDYNFQAWNRPFKLVTEVYYKILRDLIPYSADNVRIIYQGYNNSDGYSTGLDMKLNGEFVPGVDSWLSLSVMQTRENIRDDGEYVEDATGNLVWEDPGMSPRPTDQRVNVGMFFQDYFPMNPNYKMHLQINFGSGLPFSKPYDISYNDNNRMKSYQRVDLGFSKILKSSDKQYPQGHWLHHVDESWITLEVFNLMDRRNTMSYEWVSDYSGRQYAVENSLTGRRLNLRFMVRL